MQSTAHCKMNRRFAPKTTQLLYKLRKSLFICLVLILCLYSITLVINTRSYNSTQYVPDDDPMSVHFGAHFNASQLFLIEPKILLDQNPDLYRHWFHSKVIQFDRDPQVLTVGTFDNEMTFTHFKNIAFVDSIYGKSPFLSRSLPLHHLVSTDNQLLHIVVFYRFENFFWTGEIPQNFIDNVSKSLNITIRNFGLHQQIFDPFNVTKEDWNSFLVPTDIGHFLGQMSTSRYLHCTEDSQKWAKKYNMKYDPSRAQALHKSIVSMKSLMKKIQFEFWIFCGTLLGWYRQCSVIPYTTDADYATWSSSLAGQDYSKTLQTEAPSHDLKLFYRFGEPTMTQEFSIMNSYRNFKSDLFFIYPNETHFRLPWHVASKHQWTYSVYPKFELCSGVLMGEKVLVPCTPEDVIMTEYGRKWMVPVTEEKFDWIKSPPNVEPFRTFNFFVKQYTQY